MKYLILLFLFSCAEQPVQLGLVEKPVDVDEPQNKINHHSFRDAEKWAKRFNTPKRNKWQHPKEIIEIMKLEEGDHVADIGAGTGYMLPYLSKGVGSSGKVYALDIEDTLIAFMNKLISKKNLNNTVAEIIPTDDPKLQGKEINKVLFVNTWHHVKKPVEYAVKVRDSLVKSGIVFLVEPDPKVKSDFGPKHKIDPEVFLAQWKAAGYSCHLHDEKLPYQYVISCLVLN